MCKLPEQKYSLVYTYTHACQALIDPISTWTKAILCDRRLPHSAACLQASHSQLSLPASSLIDLQLETQAGYSSGRSTGCVRLCVCRCSGNLVCSDCVYLDKHPCMCTYGCAHMVYAGKCTYYCACESLVFIPGSMHVEVSCIL